MTGAGAARGIDVQHHFVVASYVAAAIEESKESAAWASSHGILTAGDVTSPARTFPGRAEALERAGLRMAMMSVPPVAFRKRSRAVEAARASNTELLNAAASDPEHFRIMGSLPLPFVEESLEELDGLRANPLVAGVILPAGTPDWTLDQQTFWPLYEIAAAAGLPIMVHPALEQPPRGCDEWGLRGGMITMETSTATMRLILSGTLDAIPTLDLIIPHLGGFIPYQSLRFEERCGRGDAKEDIPYYLQRRLYYDNCSYHKPALHCAIETVGADRIMLGSDYPYARALSRCVDDITGEPLLDDDQREGIMHGTAERVFRGIAATSSVAPHAS